MPKRILIVSLGSIGRRHLKNARKLLPDAEIAVFRQHGRNDGIPEGANLLFHDLTAALAFSPEAVIISSPASEHLRNSRDFARNRASLFLEKPLAATAADNREFLALSRGGCFIMVGYVLRFLPILAAIRGILARGELGEVRTAHVQVGQYLPDWRPDSDYREGVSAQRALGGGALLELSHEIDYASWLFGFPDSLLCSAARLSDLDIDVEDSAHLILEYGDRKRVALQLDFLQRVANMQLQVVGSEGTLQADLVKETARISRAGVPDGHDLGLPRLSEGNEIYLRQFDFFFHKSFADYQCHFSETAEFRDWVTVEHAARVMQVVDLAKRANESGARALFPSGVE